MPKCATCKADIEFIPTESGRLMPVDAMPASTGNLELVEANGRRFLRSVKIDPEDDGVANGPDDNPYRLTRYTSHFATCTEAAKYRNMGTA